MALLKKLKTFIADHKHFYLLIFLIPILIWFKYLEATLAPVYIIHAALDDWIPMVPVFVIPYILWFPYVAYAILFTGLNSDKDFYRLLLFLAGGMSVACILYMTFPSGLHLRPVIAQNDPFSMLVKFIYATDTPTNVCPSIHVINSIAVNASLQHSDAFAGKRFGRQASAILTAFICLSTVLIKQHSIVDVLVGIIISVLFYIPLYWLPDLKLKRAGRDVCQSSVYASEE
jgi:membrane-associated phospholipid phosphatase